MKKRLIKKKQKMQTLAEQKIIQMGAQSGAESTQPMLEQILRLRADFDNYRKRIEREKESAADRIRMGVLKDFLEICDSLRQAAENKSPNESPDAAAYREGMELLLKKFEAFLEKEGVSHIETAGCRFDPRLHDAVMLEEGEPSQSGTISRELLKGYKFKNEVLRPARVSVFK